MDLGIQLILTLAPAITSVIGIIAAVIAGVKKVKKSSDDTVSEVEKLNAKYDELLEEMKLVIKENVELKKQQAKLMAKVQHIHFIDKEE